MFNYKYLVMALLAVSCGTKETAESATITLKDGTKEPLAVLPVLSEELATPESVGVRNGEIFIANIGGNPGASPKLGYLTRIDNNEEVTHLFKNQLDDPKGFVFLTDSIILISDHPNVKLLNIETEKVIATLPIAAGFLNDMVRLDAYNALLSDTGTGNIHRITVNEDYTALAMYTFPNIKENGINGMAFDGVTRTLYFVTSTFGGDATKGHIFQGTLSADFSQLTDIQQWGSEQLGAGGLDGIVIRGNALIVSDWGAGGSENSAEIFGFNRQTKELHFTINGNITSVADFALDYNMLYLPEFSKNRVQKINLDKYLP